MKFLRKIFTNPVKPTEFNPGRRAALGAGAAGAAAVAVGAKHAVKQAPEVSTRVGRTESEKSMLMDLYIKDKNKQHSHLTGREYLGGYLPIKKGHAEQLGISKRRKALGFPVDETLVDVYRDSRNVVDRRNVGVIHNPNIELVDLEQFARSGGTDRFALAISKRGEDTTLSVIPDGWNPPGKKITGKQAENLFPSIKKHTPDEIIFETGLDVYDVLQRRMELGADIASGHVFDKNWKYARPDVGIERSRYNKSASDQVAKETSSKRLSRSAKSRIEKQVRESYRKDFIENVRLADRRSRELEKTRSGTYDGWKKK